MGTTDRPPEIAELIIHFASDPSPEHFWRADSGHPGYKRTLLSCALVCKAWLWPARRRLIRLNPGLGNVRVPPKNLPAFLDILLSPLCTLDPRFIRVLEVAHDSKIESSVSFSKLVSAIDKLPLLSLHTLTFRGVILDLFDGDEGEDFSYDSPAPPPTTLPQIKVLTIESPGYYELPFEYVVFAARYFPSLETLTARTTERIYYRRGAVYSMRPPQSLRGLSADTSTFLRMVEWFKAYEPKHTSISAVSIYESITHREGQKVAGRVSSALEVLGPSLEEFGFVLFSRHYFNFHENNVFLFTKNTSLKKIRIKGDLDVVSHFVTDLFEIVKSVPNLEEFEISINPWSGAYSTPMVGFMLLDAFIQTYTSLRQVDFVREATWGDEEWYEFEGNITRFMPCCMERLMIEFVDWEDVD